VVLRFHLDEDVPSLDAVVVDKIERRLHRALRERAGKRGVQFESPGSLSVDTGSAMAVSSRAQNLIRVSEAPRTGGLTPMGIRGGGISVPERNSNCLPR
jgi:5-deoxy-D-glucuronate isomerase